MKCSQSELLCNKIMTDVVVKSTQILKDNRTIKTRLSPYANFKTSRFTNQMALQITFNADANHPKFKSIKFSRSAKKDTFCSMPTILNKSLKQQNQMLFNKIQGKGINEKPHPINKIQLSKKTELKTEQNNLIDLTSFEANSKADNQISTKKSLKTIDVIEQQKKYEEEQQKYHNELQKAEKQKKRQKQKQKQQQQRLSQIKNKLQTHLSQKNNKISYDFNGQILFLTANTRHQHSAPKKYPPLSLCYKFEQPPPQNSPKQNKKVPIQPKNQQQKIVNTTTTKPSNLPKLNLQQLKRACEIDEHHTTQANDLFNNNSSRQVSAIPYISISQGINFIQTNTNFSVCQKNSSRSTLSQTKNQFKIHPHNLTSRPIIDPTKQKKNYQTINPQNKSIINKIKQSSKIYNNTSFNKMKLHNNKFIKKNLQKIAQTNSSLLNQLIQ